MSSRRILTDELCDGRGHLTTTMRSNRFTHRVRLRRCGAQGADESLGGDGASPVPRGGEAGVGSLQGAEFVSTAQSRQLPPSSSLVYTGIGS
jgi:hypothetical protein